MSEVRYEVRFAPEATVEYEKLDKSVIKMVNNAIDKLEKRADEIGTPLNNYQNTKLAGCKEIKLKDAGVRIIFIISDYVVNILQVVYILTIERREKDRVFKIANERYQKYKKAPQEAIERGKCRHKSK